MIAGVKELDIPLRYVADALVQAASQVEVAVRHADPKVAQRLEMAAAQAYRQL